MSLPSKLHAWSGSPRTDAIVEPISKIAGTDEDTERLAIYRFGLETMEEAQIRVLTTADMNRVAETARRELHV